MTEDAAPYFVDRKLRTARKAFGHVFQPNPSPCVPGFSCCMCGYFTEKLDAKA